MEPEAFNILGRHFYPLTAILAHSVSDKKAERVHMWAEWTVCVLEPSNINKKAMAVYTCRPSTWEVEAGRSGAES